jgi:leucine dehydrogenase
MFEACIRGWDGEEVVVRHDRPSNAWMFVGVHSTTLGPAFGGTRVKVYGAPADGLRDALRLSSAMTLKNAAAGLPFGGGKAVIAVPALPESDDRVGLLERYATLVDALGGTYVTACDMNTTEADMDLIAGRTEHVLGRSEARGGSGNPAPATAAGVLHGIRASVAHAFGEDALAGRRVLVQGAGAVGGRLAELLRAAGAVVLVADPVAARVRDAVERAGAEPVDASDAIGVACDVFAPCASGGILSEETIPRLRCAVVAGAANNQLATGEDAERLRDAGILYAPDFVINAGGVMSLAGLERLGWTRERLDERLASIGDTLAEVYAVAAREGLSTDAAARRLADARLEEAAPARSSSRARGVPAARSPGAT